MLTPKKNSKKKGAVSKAVTQLAKAKKAKAKKKSTPKLDTLNKVGATHREKKRKRIYKVYNITDKTSATKKKAIDKLYNLNYRVSKPLADSPKPK